MAKTLWNSDILKRSGHQMNQDILRAFHEYCSGGTKPLPINLLSAATFSALVMANMNPDPKKRDLMYYLLQQAAHPKTYKKLKVFKWTPVQSILNAYADIKTKDYNPTLSRLVALQQERMEKVSPSWGALMPDKIYAISQFSGLPSGQLDKLMLPFGNPTQLAFAMYTGVEIKGQPKLIHHDYLRQFCASWAHNTGTPDASPLAINSGLYIFGETELQGE